MNNKPPDKPKFLCGMCQDVLCEDCASIAGEYEFLYDVRTRETARALEDVKRLMERVDKLEREVELWKSVSKAGLPEIIQAWMDDKVKQDLKMIRKIGELEKILARPGMASNGESGDVR